MYVAQLTQFHAIKTAKSAAKKAKQHELQRHVRQLKQVRSRKQEKHAPVEELEEELVILKRLDTQQIAMAALTSKLVKSKLLPRPSVAATLDQEGSKAFPVWPLAEDMGLGDQARPAAESAREERVMHQVQSAKVLAEELASSIQSILGLVVPRVPKERAPAKRAETDPAAPAPEPKKKAAKAKAPVAEDDYVSDDGFSDGDAQSVMSQFSASNMDMDNLDAMVGSGSEDEMDVRMNSDAEWFGK